MIYQLLRVCFSLLPIIMGLFILSNTLLNLNASLQAVDWPTTQGQMRSYNDGSIINYSGVNSASLQYHYRVNGVEYSSQRAAFGGGKIRDTQQLDAQSLTVYYNPINHSESVLYVGFHFSYLLHALIAIALMLLGKHLWHRLK
ncbi:MAG: DUF3592 domain-containing protein [Gammaproteobacteria bacterium]|nr:DUF3592 domain-containing protein [Gammaproteobacteria bacterium]MCF6229317.1 DUF3592 domain-containing protein [Gammaproteobacteria bacterium]